MIDWLTHSWDGFVSFLTSIDWSFWGVWSLTITLMVIGVLGAILPLLPGPLLIFLAGIVHTVLRPESAMSWTGVILLAVLLAAAYFVDVASGAVGARWFGASRWGMLGVLIGGIVGFFLGLIGLILGPLVGGFAFEMIFAKKEFKPAAKSTWGTIVGTGVGLVARIAITLAMVAVFFWDALR